MCVTIGCLFEGYKFHEWTEKEAPGNYFHESTLVSFLQSAIRFTIEFPLIFGETNFVEVPKIHEIHEFLALEKRHPTVCHCQSVPYTVT